MIEAKTFFLIGFQKSGTSTIHSWLNQISSIALPDIKETHYFSESSNYNKGIKWYLKHFCITPSTEYLGEIDPSYSLSKEYLLNIKRTFISTSKFIFIMRKPIDRAYSHYLMSKLKGYEKLSFNDSLNIENDRLKNDNTMFSLINYGYFERSLYYKFINIFKNVYEDKEPLFLKFEDLKERSTKIKLCSSISNYLDTKIDINSIDIDKIENKASSYRNAYIQKILYEDYFIKNILRKAIPDRMATKLKIYLANLNKVSKNIEKVDPVSLVDDKYIELNNDITSKVEKITKLDLSDWYCYSK